MLAQTCSPRDQELQTENLNEEEKIKNLQFCFDPKCSTRTKRNNKCNTYEDGGLNGEAIAGIVIGLMVVVHVVITAIVNRHKRAKSRKPSSHGRSAFSTDPTARQRRNAHDNPTFRSQNQSSSGRTSFQHQSSINNQENYTFHPQNQSIEFTVPQKNLHHIHGGMRKNPIREWESRSYTCM
ncbi:unnamed protein product [Mytilus coruscus]|uniref:Uncharacterized protein n=1 Tax=Mytilus coruscus TaxID=42192 RepID=A0A6J8E8F8_MYTCO|nr:unnamed protein product [Mytilus coruscus]